MKIVKGPIVTQIRIFSQDSIPYSDLAIRKNFDRFKERFLFSSTEIPFPLHDARAPKIINLSGGSIIVEDESFLIRSLNFDERKISLVIEAPFDKADKAFDIIGEELSAIDRYKNFVVSDYLIKTEETQCTVHLDVDYHRFFSQRFISFIKRQVLKYSKRTPRKVTLKSLNFEIAFRQDKELEDVRISIAPKLFTIEPRTATREEDRIFYTRSPYDSATHLKVLTDLESLFIKK